MKKKLYRNSNNAMIGGVCSGIADYMEVDTTVVRIAAVALIFLAGMSLWVYIFMWAFIPRK